jgi:hypothetical protein
MSDFADDMRAMREYQQKKKAANLKTNSEIVLFLAGYLGFGITQHSAFHFSLFHSDGRRMDYWPSTRRATWFKNKRAGKTFAIQDIEQYILKHFAPPLPGKI